jgi:hypothetical protein
MSLEYSGHARKLSSPRLDPAATRTGTARTGRGEKTAPRPVIELENGSDIATMPSSIIADVRHQATSAWRREL